jgi:hypothetical protein
VSEAEVRRVLTVEIGDLLTAEGEGSAGADRLTLRCAGNLAWVEATAADGSGPVDRNLRLDDFPGDAAPRALALVGLELLAARSPALRERMQARQDRATARAIEPSPPVGASPLSRGGEHRLALGLAATWRTFLVGHGLVAWGGRGDAVWQVGRVVRIAVDGEVARGSRDVRLGEVSGLLLSGGATVGLRGESGRFGAAVGLGGRVGAVRLSGSADTPAAGAASVWRPWGGPLVDATGTVRLGRLALGLSAEVGRTLFSDQGLADDTTAVAVAGTWLAVSVAGWFLP